MAIDEKALDTALAKLEASAGLPIRRAVANAILAYEAAKAVEEREHWSAEALRHMQLIGREMLTKWDVEAASDDATARAAMPDTEEDGHDAS